MTEERERLHEGFARFVAAAHELEQAYVALKARADAVDVELRSTNHALQQSLREREAVFAALPIGLVALRADGSVASRNREAIRLCALGARTGVALERAATGEVVCDGALVRVRRTPLPDGELVLLEDRSRMHELEREVHRLDRLAGLSELALGIAHEIKNPLNGVMGFAALLERAHDHDVMRRYAGKIVRGVRQVDEIVKTMLGFARPEGQRGRVAMVAEVVADAAQIAGLPAARVRLTGQHDLRADAGVLVRVLSNLFRNAIEAAPAVTIDVQAKAAAGRLELVVQDDGPGVPPDLGSRVFEPFVSTKERGTGLGLPLCVRVLSFLGGDLELLNGGEPGARFRVRLPLAEEPAVALASEAVV